MMMGSALLSAEPLVRLNSRRPELLVDVLQTLCMRGLRNCSSALAGLQGRDKKLAGCSHLTTLLSIMACPQQSVLPAGTPCCYTCCRIFVSGEHMLFTTFRQAGHQCMLQITSVVTSPSM
jgi:hypothetical protein